MSTSKKSKDAEDILSEFQDMRSSKSKTSIEPQLESPAPEPQLESQKSNPTIDSNKKKDGFEEDKKSETPPERNVIYIGTKPIMSYVAATLTQLSTLPVVTIKARGKRITQAVDVSQMIVKRMDTVGYFISDVRISSDSLTSQDGKKRNVSTIELDIAKK